MSIASLWPLFGLRIRSERLVLRLPTDDDLVTLVAVAKAGVHAANEMPFAVPWSTKPSPLFEQDFLRFHWLQRATWSTDAWDLILLVEHEGRIVGAQSVGGEDFAVLRTIATGSWLTRDAQGRGLGTEMRAAVLAFAFETLGAEVAVTQAFVDNAQSNAVSRRLGYAEDGIGRSAPLGIARDSQRFRMTLEMWRSRARPSIAVEGFDACRSLFGQ